MQHFLTKTMVEDVAYCRALPAGGRRMFQRRGARGADDGGAGRVLRERANSKAAETGWCRGSRLDICIERVHVRQPTACPGEENAGWRRSSVTTKASASYPSGAGRRGA